MLQKGSHLIFVAFLFAFFSLTESLFIAAPGNVTVHNKTKTSLYITWEEVNGTILGYRIRHRLNSTSSLSGSFHYDNCSHSNNCTHANNSSLFVCKNRTFAELTELEVYTDYWVEVIAFTNGTFGNESIIRVFRTDEGVPLSPPGNVTVFNTSSTTIMVTWSPPEQSSIQGVLLGYEITYTPAWKNASATRRVMLCWRNTSFELESLHIYTPYNITVAAFTKVGIGKESEMKQAWTDEDRPGAAPQNVTAVSKTFSSIHVSWEPVPEDKRYGKIIEYEVEVMKHVSGGWQNQTRVFTPNRTAVIQNLTMFVNYSIRVRAYTRIGHGNYSDQKTLMTLETAPQEAPENVTADRETVTSIRVSWFPVPVGKCQGINNYNVQVKNKTDVIRNVTVKAGNLTVVIDKLEMYVTYFFQVQALTSQGAGPFSRPPVNQTTIQKAPDVVLNVTATAKSNSTIDVRGNITEIHAQLKPNGLIIEYCALRLETQKLDYNCSVPKKPCEEKYVTKMSSNEERLNNLRSFTKYRIRVRATNITAEDGTEVITPYGNYSNPVYETTHEGVPEASPSNVQAAPHSTTSIKVTWDQVNECKRNGEIKNYLVEVYNSSWQEIHYVNVSSSKYFVVVSNLQEHANYSARVQAFTNEGGGPFSEYQNTTTHQPAPRVVPENVSAVATGNSTIHVKWSPTDAPSISGFEGYSIKYEAVGQPGRNRDALVVENNEKTLTELRMFTRYKIQVAARTTQVGNYSDAVYETTLEGVPTAPPSNIDAQILDSIVQISWEEVPDAFHNGKILGYYVIYYRANNASYKQIKKTHYNIRSVQLKSLGKFSRYHVKVLAYTSAGKGVAGNISFNTSDDVPSQAPVMLKPISFVSPYKINVSWERVPDEFMNGNLINYHVKYQRVKVGGVAKEYEPVLEMLVPKTKTSVLLDNLEPFSEYKITVAAKTVKGPGPYALFRHGETCHCTERLTTRWRRYEPYVNFTDDGRPGHIIPLVLQSMVQTCCGHCDEHHQTILDFKTNGRNKPSTQNTSRELLEGMNEFTDFTFPVFGHKDQDSYKGGFGYTPVIESAGVAFIISPDVKTTQLTMFNALIRCLPVLLLPIVTAYIAGVIIWCLERINNPQDFPRSFLLGTWEGVWWSFVSMTTLGYGDRAPLSYKGRFFAILWILFGLIVIAITMAMITTALTAVRINSETKIYGSKIAAEYNSPEYNLGTRRNAKYDPDKEYHTIEEVADALINKEVKGILVDTYAAGLRGDLFNRPGLKVSQVLDYKTAYGVVLGPNSTRLGKCFEGYMDSHRAEIFDMIKRKVKPIETSASNQEAAQEDASGGLLDSGSSTFNKALRYASIMLGIALCFSLIYECIRRIRTRQKVDQKVHFKTILLKEMRSLVEEFIQRMKQTKAKLGEKHRKQIIRYWKLKRKSMCRGGNESEWLRIAMASPHRGDVMVSDL